MSETAWGGLDLAKNVFQVHGTDAVGKAVLRRKRRRGQVLEFFASLPHCFVAMEACAGADYWGRALTGIGHDVRLSLPIYVKPLVKRQENDAADEEAIQRPSVRTVPPKSGETLAEASVFRVREILIRQRNQSIDALRGHLGEYGHFGKNGRSRAICSALNQKRLLVMPP